MDVQINSCGWQVSISDHELRKMMHPVEKYSLTSNKVRFKINEIGLHSSYRVAKVLAQRPTDFFLLDTIA